MDAATAGRIIISDPRARRLAARGAAIAALVIATPLVLLLALVVALSGPSSPGTVGSADGIPAVYAPMYEAAASYYHVDPYVLAALHETERLQPRPGRVHAQRGGCARAGAVPTRDVGTLCERLSTDRR